MMLVLLYQYNLTSPNTIRALEVAMTYKKELSRDETLPESRKSAFEAEMTPIVRQGFPTTLRYAQRTAGRIRAAGGAVER